MNFAFQRRFVVGVVIVVVVLLVVSIFLVFRGGEPAPVVEPVVTFKQETIGSSVEGRKIEAYTYGNGAKHLVFVGGIHGGYEWNSVILAYEFLDYLNENSSTLPTGLTVTVIPSANPDGLFRVMKKEGRIAMSDVMPTSLSTRVAGRFNANEVDLNRNFDCRWQPKSTWRGAEVSAGMKAFSEPEAKAIRDFALRERPVAVVFWHSQANAVYASECEDGILPGTMTLMNTYADAAGYPAVDTFSAYPVTGDAEGWLASVGIPAITVELKTHETIEFEKNLAGAKALFDYYGK